MEFLKRMMQDLDMLKGNRILAREELAEAVRRVEELERTVAQLDGAILYINQVLERERGEESNDSDSE